MLLQHRLDRADSVSRELYATALRLADNRGLVDPGGDEGSRERGAGTGWAPVDERRRAWREELAGLIDDLTRIGRLERARLEVVLGGRTEDGAGGAGIGTESGTGSGPDRAGDTGVAS